MQQKDPSVILSEIILGTDVFTMNSPTSIRNLVFLLVCCTTLSFSQSTPLAVYLQEGFNTPGVPAGWVVTQVSGTTSNWTIVGVGTNPPIAPYAGIGQAKFNSYDAAPGHQSRLTSRRVTMSGSTDPFLSFFVYHDDEFLASLDSVYVDATTGDSIAGPWITLAGYRRPRPTPGWSQELFSLLQYSGANRLFISFRGVSQYGNNLYVDEVRIADSSFHDIGTVALLSSSGTFDDTSTPATNTSRVQQRPLKSSSGVGAENKTLTFLTIASPLNFNAIVQNYGTFSEASYQLRWQVDGQNQPAVNSPRVLPRNSRDTLTLSWLTPTPGTHVITSWTSLTADSNHSNDSLRLTVAVLDSTVIFAEMFNGIAFPPTGWSVVNRDGGSLPPWFRGSSTSVFLPYEGTAFAADNFQRANGTYIDDYLISPPIPGIGQAGRVDSLKLWVRSAFNSPPATNYPDSLMILLSTTGPDTSNFTIFMDYFSVPKTGWTLKNYGLSGRVPSNSTIRIALRYLHYNGGTSGTGSDFLGVDFLHITRSLPTSVNGQPRLPSCFALQQNYPNPFNPSTEIAFSVDVTGNTSVEVFNTIGQTVAVLFDGTAESDRVYRLRFSGENLAGGVYLCRLRSEGRTDLRKMELIK